MPPTPREPLWAPFGGASLDYSWVDEIDYACIVKHYLLRDPAVTVKSIEFTLFTLFDLRLNSQMWIINIENVLVSENLLNSTYTKCEALAEMSKISIPVDNSLVYTSPHIN